MKEKKEELLAACIILYNPNSSVIKNIQSYLQLVNVLYVIDNSEDIDSQLIENIKFLSTKIIYLPQYKNTGVAFALNLGAQLALNDEYHWLLTMDQDSYFLGDEFFVIWAEIDNKDKLGVVSASYTGSYDRWQRFFSEKFNELHFAVTSGNAINLNAWTEIGGFDNKLFIDEVDHDYCIKLRNSGYKIITSKKVLMEHSIGEFYQQVNNNIETKKKINIHSPVRYYYISRNVLYLCKKYFFIDFNFVLVRLYYLIKTLVRIILLYPNKSVYLRFFFTGVKDFVLSKYDKYNA